MKIAAAQISCVVGDVGANVAKLRDFAERAKTNDAEWVVFPEMSDTGYAMDAIRQHAVEWTTGAVPELRSVAKQLSLGIVCGVSERDADCIFNTQAVIDARGDVMAKYRKTHLFQPAPVEEHTACTAGADLVSVQLGDFRAGLAICYDLRFPEIFRSLAVEDATNVFVISSAWPFPRAEHLRTLTLARAIENQSYAVLANGVGTDNDVTFCGGSCIVDPSGNVVATASADREELLVAEISQMRLEEVRAAMPVFEHRRPDVYRQSFRA